MLITDGWSDLYWYYYLSNRKASLTIITALKHLFEILKRQYDVELPKHSGS